MREVAPFEKLAVRLSATNKVEVCLDAIVICRRRALLAILKADSGQNNAFSMTKLFNDCHWPCSYARYRHLHCLYDRHLQDAVCSKITRVQGRFGLESSFAQAKTEVEDPNLIK
jgi:hypothetical protein